MAMPRPAQQCIARNCSTSCQWHEPVWQINFTPIDHLIDQITLPRETTAIVASALKTDGSSRYREAQVTARYQFHGADQIVASYTRSSAFGNLNDFNTFFGNIENPVIRPDARGPLAWDAPQRVLLWSSISLPRGFAVFPVLRRAL